MNIIKNSGFRVSTIMSTLLSAFFLSSCGSDKEKIPPAPSYTTKSSCLDTRQWAFEAKGTVRSTALVEQNFVYFGDSEGNLYSLNQATGTLNWQIELEGALDSKIQLVDDKLLITSDAGKLSAVNPIDGSLQWQTEIGAMLRTEYDYNISSPIVKDKRAFIGQENGSLVGVNVENGEQNWKVDLTSPAHSQPIIVGETICVSSTTDLTCIDIPTKKYSGGKILTGLIHLPLMVKSLS